MVLYWVGTLLFKQNGELLWELLLLLQLKAFKIPAHLGVVSYTINEVVKPTLALMLLAFTSGCKTLFLFPIHAEDCNLGQ